MADTDQISDDEEYTQKWWVSKLVKREKELDNCWRDAADHIVERYLDKRIGGGESTLTNNPDARKYNIFWANTQIIKAALYATPPKPSVTRQYGDAKDDVARTAALMLQRILSFGLEGDSSDMHNSFLVAVEDRLIPGLGQVWMRLETETEKTTVPAVVDPMTGQELAPATEGEKITHQEVCTEYVHWRDFLWEASRVWSDCGWVARRVWMRKVKFIKRFGKEKYEALKNAAKEHQKSTGKNPKGFTDGKVEVFEVWCLDTNRVYWINRFADEKLDEKPDPLQLDDFYPCPQPLLATHTTNDFVPRPDFTMVQDQYEELDVLNMRISILTKALRVVGVYDKENTELKALLSGAEFNMIPVDSWEAFSEKGGLKEAVDWFPVDVIAGVLEKLMQQRIAVINQIYELTSISDIMRGASNPRDTLGAQKLKAQYSSVRLQLNQQDVGKFVRQALRIKAEIICRHFEPRRILQISQIEFTESAQYANEALALLKNYQASEYRVNVGEETLSIADYNAERELRIEYLTAVGQFISQGGQIMEQMPQATPYLLKMIAWVTAAFRGASDIESVLDQAIDAASKPAEGPAKPDPAVEKEKAAAERAKVEGDAEVALENARTANALALGSAEFKNDLKRIIAEVLKSGIEHSQAMEAQETKTADATALQEQKAADAQKAQAAKKDD